MNHTMQFLRRGAARKEHGCRLDLKSMLLALTEIHIDDRAEKEDTSAKMLIPLRHTKIATSATANAGALFPLRTLKELLADFEGQACP